MSTSTGNGCAVSYSTLKGVGFINTNVNPHQLLILALKPDNTDGLVIIGNKTTSN